MSWGQAVSILVIDDDIEFCKTVVRILEPEYDIEYTTNINEMAQKLLSKRYAVILLDYYLDPKFNGIQIAKDIHGIYPLTYIIMISGYADFEDIKEVLNSRSVDHFLAKPITQSDLVKAVENAIATYISNHETSMMLNPQSEEYQAKDVLADIFENVLPSSTNIDLNAVIISKNSIPVYSKFIDSSRLNNFTDTIFTGFMTALNMVGQEAFSLDNNVSRLIFGEMAICFEFYRDYQFSFIVHLGDYQEPDMVQDKITIFVKEVIKAINSNDKYFAYNNDISKIDGAVDELVKTIASLNHK